MAEFSDARSGAYCTCTRERCSDECRTYRQFRPKPITNADRIRSMSDEKLARWIALHPCLPSCPAQTEECFKTSKFESCTGRWLEWLKQEVESNDS